MLENNTPEIVFDLAQKESSILFRMSNKTW